MSRSSTSPPNVHSNGSVCVVAPLTELSGNLNTARRIASFVDGTVIDALPTAASSSSPPPMQCGRHDGEGAVLHGFSVCILIHALRSGQVVFPDLFRPSEPTTSLTSPEHAGQCTLVPLSPHSGIDNTRATTDSGVGPLLPTHRPRGRRPRYILVFGGTDVNEFAEDEALREIMGRVIQRVDVVVCFSASLKAASMQRWSRILSEKMVVVVPQAVVLQHGCVPHCIPCAQAPLGQSLSANGLLLDSDLCRGRWKQSRLHPDAGAHEGHVRFALWPGGIRQVKDPMFAIEAWSYLQATFHVHNVVLVLVGPLLEERVSASVLHAVETMDRVVWHPGLEQSALYAFMQHPLTLCVLNTSRSEGQPQSVLEAMWGERLVVARDIPANAELLADGRGLLVASPRELAQCVANVASGGVVDAVMTAAAAKYVRTYHAAAEEERRYRQLVSDIS